MISASLRFLIAALLITSAAVFLQAHGSSEIFPPRLELQRFPQQLGPWTGTDIPIEKEVLDVLGPGDFLLRDYEKDEPEQISAGQANSDQPSSGLSGSDLPGQTRSSSGEPTINLFIAYFPSQRAGDTIHSPQNCLPGAGWSPIENSRITLSIAGHPPFPANRYIIAKGDSREVVLYWYWAHNRGVASEYLAKYHLIDDSIRMNRSDGALVRISSVMLPGETPDVAESRLLPFTSSVVPLLDTYIPR